MKVFIKNLNPCAARRVNIQQYKDCIVQNSHQVVDTPEEASVILIWSCGFRTDYKENSVKQAQNYLDRYNCRVILAGCVPDIDPVYIKKNFHGTVVSWKEDEKFFKDFFGDVPLNSVEMDLGKPQLCESSEKFKKENPSKDACFLDESIQLYVSEGCALNCSYCTERLMFPGYQSYPFDKVVDKCRQLVSSSDNLNIMLHADSVGDYGVDIGTDLPSLIKALVKIKPGIKIGMQGFNPAHFIKYFDEMVSFIKEGYIWDLRIPVQSASDKILKSMKRDYTVKDLHRIFSKLQELGFSHFSTDFIVGFPGEAKEDYQATIDFLKKYKPTYVLLSAYMDLPFLESYKLDGKLEETAKRERLLDADKILRSMGVYCSTDGGFQTDERRRRLNNDYRL